MREALARLAEANIPKLQKWLDAVKDPAKRFSLFLDLCEYHLPRLARTELTGLDGEPLQVRVLRFDDSESSFTGLRPKTMMINGEANSVASELEQEKHR